MTLVAPDASRQTSELAIQQENAAQSKPRKKDRSGTGGDAWFDRLSIVVGPEAAERVCETLETFSSRSGNGLSVNSANLSQLAKDLVSVLGGDVITKLGVSPAEAADRILEQLELQRSLLDRIHDRTDCEDSFANGLPRHCASVVDPITDDDENRSALSSRAKRLERPVDRIPKP